MPNVSVTYKNGVQKGPATDYSMLLQMKRRSLIVADVTRAHGPLGTKRMGQLADNNKSKGFTDGQITPVVYARGALLGFFRF